MEQLSFEERLKKNKNGFKKKAFVNKAKSVKNEKDKQGNYDYLYHIISTIFIKYHYYNSLDELKKINKGHKKEQRYRFLHLKIDIDRWNDTQKFQ